ncbi:MAG: NUDIX hydrolase [Acidimicrobiia bacterium]
MPGAPSPDTDLLDWTVAGGLVENADGLLMVRNVRHGGRVDWTPPGGVIDATDRSLAAGLTREVVEETGITVGRWDGPVYTVRADAPDMGWRMSCEVHYALEFDGELLVDDPDEIVVAAEFLDDAGCSDVLSTCPPWVREPLAAWMAGRWSSRDAQAFHYEVRGTRVDALEVRRLSP